MAPEQHTEPSWPPRSPHEALLSTPRGRQRYREMMNQISPTSSPSSHRTRRNIASTLADLPAADEDDDEDEDEETLQLKLQEIQARLKLKRLQRAKEKEAAAAAELRRSPDESWSSSPAPAPAAAAVPPSQRFARMKTPEMEDAGRGQSAQAPVEVQVPASPVRKPEPPPLLPKSPSRVLLGIDKGLRAKDISLKRAPSFRRTVGVGAGAGAGAGEASGSNNTKTTGILNRSKSYSCIASPEASRPLSFNERLAAARIDETARSQRQERVSNVRSNAFGIGKDEMEEYKKQAVDIPDEPLMSRSFTRDEVLGGKPRSDSSSGTTLASSQTAASFRSVSGLSNTSDSASNHTAASDPKSSSMTVDSQGQGQGQGDSSFEPYSSFHLSRRILPHRVLARHVSGKKTFNIKDLLRTVKAPDFALPDIEQDIVIFAVVAKKSDPRSHKPPAFKSSTTSSEDPKKYMVLNLVDLEYELDLFLFNTGFTRYWKLTEGTVVAILNPSVMPPPPGRQDTGRFSLVINSDEDTILEIGSARDLGSCQAIKRDGSLCGAWVNKRRTQYCEFHSNEAVRKQRAGRMEVNSTGFGGGGRDSRDRFKSQQNLSSKDPFDGQKKSSNYDWETRTQWFVSKTHSAADLIDGKDRSAADRKEKAEFLKRSLEAKEREREMMKKLGQVGHAAGREYMQRAEQQQDGNTSNSNSNSNSNGDVGKPVVTSLFLDKERRIRLSPIKRKRTGSSTTGGEHHDPDLDHDHDNAGEAAAAGTTANGIGNGNANGRGGPAGVGLGWGSGLRDKLAGLRDGEKLNKGEQPLRKKTRFVTEKGIREAGRESLGKLEERQVVLGDDDDELVIVN